MAGLPVTSEQNAAAFTPESDNVFARIAERYDFLCDIFSLGIHRVWKSRVATLIADAPGTLVLDAASGTGDIPIRVLRRLRRAGAQTAKEFLITDICPQMLDIARRKFNAEDNVKFGVFDVHDLREVPSESVDIYSISFGMKICDRARTLSEAFRILRPGGQFLCLEAARIPVDIVHAAYLKYMNWCLPLMARIAVGGDAGAYNYLLRGLHNFPAQLEFAKELAAHGFEDTRFENLTLGIVAIHRGSKPLALPTQVANATPASFAAAASASS